MISFETFKKKVVVEMEQRVGEGKVFLESITKNNDTKITGLMIREDDCNISPIIYLENFYADLHEKTLAEIVEDIWELYQDKKLPSNIELSTFLRWEDARNRIVMKVVNYQYNEALLKTIPHNRFLDLAIVYYYIYDMNEDYEATIMVTNAHMHMWSVDLRELKEVAYENYPKFYEACVKALDEIVRERMGVCADQLFGRTSIYVVTNQRGTFGATMILFPDILKVISEFYGDDLYILPSSIHEILVLPKYSDDVEKLKITVREVNELCVEQKELLSDQVYLYQRNSGKVEIAAE